MEKIKIRIGSLGGDIVLDTASLEKDGDNITMSIPQTIANRVSSGETIVFLRTETFDGESEVVAKKSLPIIASEGNTITLEVPKRDGLITIVNQLNPELILFNGVAITKVLDPNDIDYSKGDLYYTFKLSERVNIFEKDILFCKSSVGEYTYKISLFDLATNEEFICNSIIPIYEQDGDYIAVAANSDTIDQIRTNGGYVVVNQNEFFAENRNGKIKLWSDLVSNTSVTVRYTGGHINIPIQAAPDSDFEKMDMELNIHNIYDSVIDSIVPDIIDYEKVRYNPVIKQGDVFYSSSAISINLHFRERKKKISSSVEFEDGWYIDTAVTSYWRDYDSYSDVYQNYELDRRSDNLCELNFTDDDVKYRKNKLKKSFLRLSFYNSTNPFEQSLLCYSTIFLDATDLCGKYIRLKVQDKYSNSNSLVSDYSVDEKYRLSTKFVITDEFDTTKSSEGFYIYLFADDAPENEERTIYMKVEFNHAGYGKTLPLIIWPKDERGEPVPLYASDYFNTSYIKVNILKKDGKFLYYVPDATNYNSGLIELNLFEPVISPLLDS